MERHTSYFGGTICRGAMSRSTLLESRRLDRRREYCQGTFQGFLVVLVCMQLALPRSGEYAGSQGKKRVSQTPPLLGQKAGVVVTSVYRRCHAEGLAWPNPYIPPSENAMLTSYRYFYWIVGFAAHRLVPLTSLTMARFRQAWDLMGGGSRGRGVFLPVSDFVVTSVPLQSVGRPALDLEPLLADIPPSGAFHEANPVSEFVVPTGPTKITWISSERAGSMASVRPL